MYNNRFLKYYMFKSKACQLRSIHIKLIRKSSIFQKSVNYVIFLKNYVRLLLRLDHKFIMI